MRGSFDVNENYYPIGVMSNSYGHYVTDMVELEPLHNTPFVLHEAQRIARECNRKYRVEQLRIQGIRDYVHTEVASLIARQGV